jgi:hypothetical protein
MERELERMAKDVLDAEFEWRLRGIAEVIVPSKKEPDKK